MIAVCDMGPLHFLVLAEKLEILEGRTSFYVGEKARAVIDGMKQRDNERKLARGQQSREQNAGE
jgi:hypothetical protein